MVCAQNNSVVSCFGASGCDFEGSGKMITLDISEVRYLLRCTMTIDNFKVKDWPLSRKLQT